MRKNARVLNAFILSILLLGILVFVIKLNILPLKFIPIDQQYNDNINHQINELSLMEPLSIAKELFTINTVYGLGIGGIGASFAVNKHLKV